MGPRRRYHVRAVWLLVVAGAVLAAACLVLVVAAPAAVRPWTSFMAGFSLMVLGIILIVIWRAR
jgi:hypothetical protein